MSFDPSQFVKISPHASLKSRKSGDALVLPERALRIGGSGAEILRLCGPQITGQSIIEVMTTRYPDTVGIESEVCSFLEEMIALGGVVSTPRKAEGKS